MNRSSHPLRDSLRRVSGTVISSANWTEVYRREPPRSHPVANDGVRSEAEAAHAGTRSAKLARLEAVLFTMTDPMSTRKLAKLANLSDAAEVRGLVKELAEYYDQDGTSFTIENVAGGWQLRTRREFSSWLEKTRGANAQPDRLSQPALETLSIIAYRQPVLRGDVEAIRGVGCGEMIRQLIERGLVKVVGLHDSLGRPRLYGTTRRFLERFGLSSLEDLPMARELRRPEEFEAGEVEAEGTGDLEVEAEDGAGTP